MINTWLMWGLFPASLVFAGFAPAAAVNQNAGNIAQIEKSLATQTRQMTADKNELKVLLLENQLAQLFDAWCGAKRRGSRDEAAQWERQYNAAEIEYNRLSPQTYPKRQCG